MTRLTVLKYPDPKLRNKAKPVDSFNGDLKQLIDDMYETMYIENGCGLAATQVGIDKRVVVMDVSSPGGDKEPRYFINPEILSAEGDTRYQEGCLSVPGVYEWVKRAEKVRFRTYDLDGNPHEEDAEGLLAICMQHEIDHLNGMLFIDRLSSIKRARAKRMLEKLKSRNL
ncbi:MAG: peptide deformylase [Gammaproteobacteria bacterium]